MLVAVFLKQCPACSFLRVKPRAPCSSTGMEFLMTLFPKSLWVYSRAAIIYSMLKLVITCSDF